MIQKKSCLKIVHVVRMPPKGCPESLARNACSKWFGGKVIAEHKHPYLWSHLFFSEPRKRKSKKQELREKGRRAHRKGDVDEHSPKGSESN
jgi:RNA polymerase subunit RPABC4/transcription elongation factor Spt4